MPDIQQTPPIEQAAAWVVNMSARNITAEQRTAFESWLAEDPRHRALYERAQRVWQPLAIFGQEALEVSGEADTCPGKGDASLLGILLHRLVRPYRPVAASEMSMCLLRIMAFLVLSGAAAAVSAISTPTVSGRCIPAFSQVDAQGDFHPVATCGLPPRFFDEVMSGIHRLGGRTNTPLAGRAHLVDAVNVMLDTVYTTMGPGRGREARFGPEALHLEHLVGDLVERGGARPDADLISEAQQWKLRYEELADQLERARIAGPEARSIRASLHRLELRKAADLLRRASRELAVEKPALGARHFSLALVEMLRFRYRAALPDLEKAHALQPDDPAIAFSLARILQDEHRPAEAAVVYDGLLARYRALPEEGREPYLADMAGILNNLGALHIHARDFPKAESAFGETLELYRALSRRNPYTYRSDMAMTLNNLGALYGESRRYGEAEAAFREALELYQKLAQENPGTYRADVTMTLGNLESLYRIVPRPGGPADRGREARVPGASGQALP